MSEPDEGYELSDCEDCGREVVGEYLDCPWCGGELLARPVGGGTMSAKGEMERLRAKVAMLLPPRSLVTVSEWVGCDEPSWKRPVYVVAHPPGGALYDAVCDLAADSIEHQAEFVVEQMLHE